MVLDRATDPPCPTCGCEQSDLLARRAREETRTVGGVRSTRIVLVSDWQCDHCGREHSTRVEVREQPTAFGRTLCSICGSERTRVTSTRDAVRHHRCRECDWRFKTARNRVDGDSPT